MRAFLLRIEDFRDFALVYGENAWIQSGHSPVEAPGLNSRLYVPADTDLQAALPARLPGLYP